MRKLLLIFVSAVVLSSCTSAPTSRPSLPATRLNPRATLLSVTAAESLLAQQVKDDLLAYPRPLCKAGVLPGKEWDTYRQGLAASLHKLFSDSRSQSLSVSSLARVFENGSNLPLDIRESTANVVLVSIVNSNCNERTGGGGSRNSPRDTVYVLDRQGGFWPIAQVQTVLDAVWAEDHWIVLVIQTLWGNGQEFEVWHVRPTVGEWKKETKFEFAQLHGYPLPRLSADGNVVTLYSAPGCDLPFTYSPPYPVIEWDYKWQDGQYRCITSRVVATVTPTKQP